MEINFILECVYPQKYNQGIIQPTFGHILDLFKNDNPYHYFASF